jgi:methyl-accepting chemotaxis protein
MFKNMTLGAKIGFGFASLILIILALGGLAVFNMKQVAGQATIMAGEKVPAARLASNIESATLLAMYEIRGYCTTEDPALLKSGQENLKKTEDALKEVLALSEKSTTLEAVKVAAEKAQTAESQYQELLKETVTQVAEFNRNQEVMKEEGAKFVKEVGDFLVSQNEAMASDIDKKLDETALKERVQKISMVNTLLDLGNQCVIASWQSVAERNPKLIEDSQNNFVKINEILDTLRPITRQAANIQQIDEAKKASAAYQAAMNGMAKAWAAREDLNKRRTETGSIVFTEAGNTTAVGMEDVTKIGNEAQASDHGVQRLGGGVDCGRDSGLFRGGFHHPLDHGSPEPGHRSLDDGLDPGRGGVGRNLVGQPEPGRRRHRTGIEPRRIVLGARGTGQPGQGERRKGQTGDRWGRGGPEGRRASQPGHE